MLEGLRRIAKRIRRRYVFGALFLSASAGYATVLVRAMAAAAAYKDGTATITLAANDASSFYYATSDASSGELQFQKPPRNSGSIPAVEFLVPLGEHAHLLRPEFQRPRQLVISIRRSDGMPARTLTRVYIDGDFVGDCRLPDGTDIGFCTFDLNATQSPPADAWHVRLEDRLGGMIVSRLVLVIGPR